MWVKPGNARCTTKWNQGTVTGIQSDNNVEVDGMPRHILDIRARDADGDEEEASAEHTGAERRYPVRDRTPPAWMGDYNL